ncbi:thiaminase II [Bifidobacterium simiarum]|uniref:Aminopyrimidine aminohydrolase n=1 Tax=Bifidobacterium simiarum TaxID=2045441 RepID=A0A2M9HH88_9BIFI|nr:thiaminase II [Bifidobacterium simiarum]MBT1165293.1 thiaminase II [Bifidobacterium simiarum]PJM76182.1 thiaminase II [Bifidobacterium simiarum]
MPLTRFLPDHPFAERLYRAAEPVWEEGLDQPFLRELADGTLDRDRFVFYMLQDYLYLNDYVNVHAIAFAKCDDPVIRTHLSNAIAGASNETEHVHDFFRDAFDITREQMASARQSAFARSYTSNMIAIAYTKPLIDILVALLPCAWVYADYGTRIAERIGDAIDANPYKAWIDMYRTDEFWDSAVWLIDDIERLAVSEPGEHLRELTEQFVVGVEHEYMFWDSAYRMQRRWKEEWR